MGYGVDFRLNINENLICRIVGKLPKIAIEYSHIWYESVLKNCRINKATLHINK